MEALFDDLWDVDARLFPGIQTEDALPFPFSPPSEPLIVDGKEIEVPRAFLSPFL